MLLQDQMPEKNLCNLLHLRDYYHCHEHMNKKIQAFVTKNTVDIYRKNSGFSLTIK